MAYSKEEIIQALRVIQETCAEYEDCCMCPFAKGGDCLVSSEKPRPEQWNLNNDANIWKAIII